MNKSRFSEEEIVGVLRQVELGAKVLDVCRKHGISDATLCNWTATAARMRRNCCS